MIRRRAIDISHVQGSIIWPRVRAAGIEAVWVKLVEGATWKDPAGVAYAQGAAEAGLRWGGYLFFRASPVADQVAHFVEQLGRAGLPSLPSLLDVERPDPAGHPGLAERALEALEQLQGATGCAPLIYCSPGFAAAQGFARVPGLARFGLLVADWRTATHPEPEIPAPWTECVGRQTGKGRVDGIAMDVDLDELQEP